MENKKFGEWKSVKIDGRARMVLSGKGKKWWQLEFEKDGKAVKMVCQVVERFWEEEAEREGF